MALGWIVRRASRHQRLDPSAVHGVTKFSDLTPDEFRDRLLGLRKSRGGLLSGSAHDAPTLLTVEALDSCATLATDSSELDSALHTRHFARKHGPGRYYGQR